MCTSSDLPPAHRRHFYRRAALAPLCLCLVAGLHVVRVWTCRQTPWKGGGFGMFSTIDDESARFLRCSLITSDGELPLPIPPAADKSVAELRAAPTRAQLDELARKMAGQSWRWRSARQIRQVTAIRNHGGAQISTAVLRPPVDEHQVIRAATDTIDPIPRDEPPVGAISFSAVRVECFRYRYDTAGNILRAELLLTAIAPREEPAK
jgi:hypothetical protein